MTRSQRDRLSVSSLRGTGADDGLCVEPLAVGLAGIRRLVAVLTGCGNRETQVLAGRPGFRVEQLSPYDGLRALAGARIVGAGVKS